MSCHFSRACRALLAIFVAVFFAGCHTKAAASATESGGPQGDLTGTAVAATDPLPAPEPGAIPPNDATPPLSGALSLGAAGAAKAANISPAGGTVATDGLAIVVPPSAVTADVAGTVTTTPIGGVPPGAYGGAITPVTDLYTVELGNGALAAPATVKLTLKPNAATVAGAVPMAFYYDGKTGAIWPLATVSSDATSIVALAPHFSSIFGALVDLAKVPTTVDSGFRPGQDDWQFTNYGSYIAPRGHCEGQVVSELWYYNTLRMHGGASGLYGLYDNNGGEKTPAFWPDDSDGYRLASTIQADPVAVPSVYSFVTGWDEASQNTSGAPDAQTYLLLRIAMAVSGQPQHIAIQDAAAESHHAILVYRVTPSTLYVADPNFPGHLRTIHYDDASGKLGPYSSGDNAKSISAKGAIAYTTFAYIPGGASASDAALSARWAQFEAGTIGNDRFPAYALVVAQGEDAEGKDIWVPLKEGYATNEATIKVALSALGDGSPAKMFVYPGTTLTPTRSELFAWLKVDLAVGENPFGFRVYGHVPSTGDFEYVDFVRRVITRTDKPVTTDATSSGGDPIIQSFDGPTILDPKDMAKTYAFSVKVTGGTPPYTFHWEARGQLLTEGTGDAFANPTFTGMQLSEGSNGERDWIWLSVTDSANHGAAWRRPDGTPSSMFAYGVDPGIGFNVGTVKEPEYPYTPANP